MKQHKFKLIKELKNTDFKQMVLDLLEGKISDGYDYWAKMLTVKVAYADFTNEIGIVIIGVCKPGTEDVVDMYFMPAFPYVLRTDADIRAYDSLVELYVRDRDDLITFKDVRA